jgi:class 3 adenylate cyclase/CHAT domain-containing protein
MSEPNQTQGQGPDERDEDVGRLLEEFASLYASLSKHQRPMAILFADLEGSTAIFGERSDLEGILALQRSESLIRPQVEAHSGTVVKTIGDAVMASFSSAEEAVKAALAIQQALEEHNKKVAEEDRLAVRIGINTGKGFVKDKDVFGQVVNIAAKVQAAARGGQILVTQATVQALGRELASRARPKGSLQVAGLSRPVEISEIVWREEREPERAEAVLRSASRAEPSEAILVLELSLEAGRLKVSASERPSGAGPTITPYHELSYPAQKVDPMRRELFDIFQRGGRSGLLDRVQLDEVERLGLGLYEALIPAAVKQKLAQTRLKDLLLNLDDSLVPIPWELLFDGEQFLSVKFNMGRLVRTRQDLREVPLRQMEPPFKMLIVANPKGDLEASFQEGLALQRDLEEQQAPVEVELVGQDASLAAIKSCLFDYDLVHFAGHADYHREAPEASAWLFSDGKLTGSNILQLAGLRPMPALVFSNACQSGFTEEWASRQGDPGIFGLAHAFLLSGVQHYIGTFWDIPDAPSAQFARAFYSSLFSGQTIGQALRQARETLIGSLGLQTTTWASYVLYGDPTVRLVARKPQVTPKPPPKTRHLTQEAEAPRPSSQPALRLGLAAAVVAGVVLAGALFLLSGKPGKKAPLPARKPPPEAKAAQIAKPARPLSLAQVSALLEGSRRLDFQNLSGLKLAKLDLSQASLQGANLEGADLRGALLWKSNLNGAKLDRANLAGAKLGKARLAGASLRSANLTGADLSGANLSRADFSRAQLQGTQFWGADLEGAVLKGSNLKEANFYLANLEGANLKGADLRGANLKDANLKGANFQGANLEGAKNLWQAKNLEKAVGLPTD